MDFSKIADGQGSDFGAVFANIFFAVVELDDTAPNHAQAEIDGVKQPRRGTGRLCGLQWHAESL